MPNTESEREPDDAAIEATSDDDAGAPSPRADAGPAARTADDAELDGGEPAAHPHRFTRRGLFGALAAGAAGLAVGGAGGAAVATGVASSAGGGTTTTYPFFGAHQAGIVTPAQDRLHFASFDVSPETTRDELVDLLTKWSYAASRMTQGLDVSASGAVGGSPFAPPDDTGEALGLPPSGLTITFGFGPSLFTDDSGTDRFGIAAQKPPLLEPLPRFSGDAIEAARSGGDLCVQACADDPQVAVHAIRNLTRLGFGRIVLRWSQLGFGRTSSTSTTQQTPRNLFGFKDGTANIKAEEAGVADEQVWVQAADGPAWMAGGSYLAARRIRMLIESWDRVSLGEQQNIFGRNKGEGAPLSGGTEFTEPNFTAPGAEGGDEPVIDMKAHVRLAHPDNNAGSRMLRRGYNYVEGNDDLGRLDAGLFFLAYVRDPDQFIAVQHALATDLLNEYIRHVGTGIWAIPPGAAEGGYVGQTLFGV
ncbi:deferrochelatase/peroxidase EfeB [Pseudoclavibacter chungangensis]|uniref:iron uptake transporter deferrochelatase/peroxidase subunit n=1 Tax=Pseudoclavibacter chungangensis TaxID=587635 RepID=UPI0018333706|nr:iron uptake transporter deferrochelatase/peroxidase subunit [Pseudoclavibacter chungangensis]NYJ68649.1 deferrochelatase/peroxidase EfeB [Pseudoclavibacter chungangensis]